jgi:hypothetical protein
VLPMTAQRRRRRSGLKAAEVDRRRPEPPAVARAPPPPAGSQVNQAAEPRSRPDEVHQGQARALADRGGTHKKPPISYLTLCQSYSTIT